MSALTHLPLSHRHLMRKPSQLVQTYAHTPPLAHRFAPVGVLQPAPPLHLCSWLSSDARRREVQNASMLEPQRAALATRPLVGREPGTSRKALHQRSLLPAETPSG